MIAARNLRNLTRVVPKVGRVLDLFYTIRSSISTRKCGTFSICATYLTA